MSVLNILQNNLVVSCQPVDDGPMDDPAIVAAMALAAQAGGAAGLRIEGIENLAAVRGLTSLPVIGIVKHDLAGSPVRITPHLEDITALATCGADIIAYDATDRIRRVKTSGIVTVIRQKGKLVMADCANLADAKRALQEGADIIGTTLSGYAYEIEPAGAGPDFELIKAFRSLGGFVMAEGRILSPDLAAHAMTAGADCVTVGSAVTRIEHITSWFSRAVMGSADG